MIRLLRLAVASLVMTSCAQERSVEESAVPLAGSALARVGQETLYPRHLKVLSAGAPRTLVELWVHDAVLAEEGRSSDSSLALVVERGELARALLEQIAAQAEAEEPVSPEELEAARQKLWMRFDRPSATRAIAIALLAQPMQDDAAAYAYMQALRARIVGVDDKQALLGAVTAYEEAAGQPDFKLSLTYLPPVAADGRLVLLNARDEQLPQPPENLRRVAGTLRPYEVSSVLATPEGFFLIYASEEIPGVRAELEAIERELVASVIAQRTQPTVTALSRRLAVSTLVQLSPKSAALTRFAWLKRDKD